MVGGMGTDDFNCNTIAEQTSDVYDSQESFDPELQVIEKDRK
jgi:hypothetical protein